MRVVLQRVTKASVTIENQLNAEIGLGLLLLVGIEDEDTSEDIEWLCRKIVNMRMAMLSLLVSLHCTPALKKGIDQAISKQLNQI